MWFSLAPRPTVEVLQESREVYVKWISHVSSVLFDHLCPNFTPNIFKGFEAESLNFNYFFPTYLKRKMKGIVLPVTWSVVVLWREASRSVATIAKRTSGTRT